MGTLRLRGFKKSRISQLMTVITANNQLVRRSVAKSVHAKLTRPVNAVAQRQAVVKRPKEVDKSIGIESITAKTVHAKLTRRVNSVTQRQSVVKRPKEVDSSMGIESII